MIYTADYRTTAPNQSANGFFNPQGENLLTVVSTPVKDIAGVTSKDLKKKTGFATIEIGDTKLKINDYDSLRGKLSINTHKILSVIIANFTEMNHIGSASDTIDTDKLIISIPLRQYGIDCGYDLKERECHTAEEIAAENKRLREEEKRLKKEVRAALDILKQQEFSWTEKSSEDFFGISFIGSRAIKDGYIIVSLDSVFAKYLISLHQLTYYPKPLLKIDARKNNAYALGYHISEHYHIYNNHLKHTENKLKVSTLLSYTTLPKYDEKAKKQGWERLIREPLESSLDELVNVGLLSEWYYCHSKDIKLTDKELNAAVPYSAFADWYVCYTMKNPVDMSDKIEKRAAQIEEKKKEKKKENSKKKK